MTPIQHRRARKVGGNYQAEGWVVAIFYTRAGKQRYVFEFDAIPGMLHIFSPEQIEYIDEREQRMAAYFKASRELDDEL